MEIKNLQILNTVDKEFQEIFKESESTEGFKETEFLCAVALEMPVFRSKDPHITVTNKLQPNK